ncbi:MAG: hypothetical protein ACXW18_11440 [Pyrinomonadaceae bacterium]
MNLIDFKQNWPHHASPFEPVMIEQVLNILATPSEKFIETKNFVAVSDQSIAQLRAKTACAACDYDPHGRSNYRAGQEIAKQLHRAKTQALARAFAKR